jgi:hypothetical protein
LVRWIAGRKLQEDRRTLLISSLCIFKVFELHPTITELPQRMPNRTQEDDGGNGIVSELFKNIICRCQRFRSIRCAAQLVNDDCEFDVRTGAV